MEDDALDQILSLRQERARLMKVIAELEIEKTTMHRLAFTSTRLLQQARDHALQAQHHLHSDESDKARVVLGKLLELVTPEPSGTKH